MNTTLAMRPRARGHAAVPALLVARERVFESIDRLGGGAVWLQGPTGAGKTVTARSYLDRVAAQRTIWLTLDASHIRAASFFASFTAGVAALGIDGLPAFAPEHIQDVRAFAVRFFASLRERLDETWAVAFDDAHLVLRQETAQCIAACVDELGPHLPVLIASQLSPDEPFYEALARGRLSVLGHRELAFDEREAAQLAQRVGLDASVGRDAAERTDGWAAGLVLTLQLCAGVGQYDAQMAERSVGELIRAYVLDGISPQNEVTVSSLGTLPWVPLELRSRGPHWRVAVDVLDDLADRGMFVRRDAGALRLHDLLRAMFKAIAVPVETRRALVDGLGALGAHELTMAAAIAGGEALVADFLRAHGEALVRSAQRARLAGMLAPFVDAEHPEAAWWFARMNLGTDPVTALRAFEHAWESFSAAGARMESVGVAALSVLTQVATQDEVEHLDTWVKRLKCLEDACAGDDRVATLWAVGAVAAHAYGLQHFDEDVIRRAQDRVLRAIGNDLLAQDESVFAALVLLSSFNMSNRLREFDRCIQRLESCELFSAAAPYARAAWCVEKGYRRLEHGWLDEARNDFSEAESLAKLHLMNSVLINALVGTMSLLVTTGQFAAVRDCMMRLPPIANAPLCRRIEIQHIRARTAFQQGNVRECIDVIDSALTELIGAGQSIAAFGVFLVDRMQACIHLGLYEEMCWTARVMCKLSRERDEEITRALYLLLYSLWHWDSHAESAILALDEGIALARDAGMKFFLRLLPNEAAIVANRSLAHGFAVDFVLDSIRMRKLHAPEDATDDWPWELSVRVLGAFEIEVAGKALAWSGKAQQRPLDLLKYLAVSPGMTADSTSICEALWPDADALAGRKSLETTLARLRKLLQHAELVQVVEGRIRLAGGSTCIDADVFWQRCLVAETGRRGTLSDEQAIDLGEQLGKLYRGDVLAGDPDDPWRLHARQRYRNAFLRAVRALARYWESHQRPQELTRLLEMAIEREPMAEELHQALMRAYQQLGASGDALRVYRQLRQTLFVASGARPSETTERLRMSIRDGQ